VTQRPSSQRAAPVQALPQAPQWALSRAVSTQPTPAHQRCGREHEHRPWSHQAPAPQELPHAPQWSGSPWRSTQALPQAEARAAGHAHTPPRQTRPVASQRTLSGCTSKVQKRAAMSQRSLRVQGSVSPQSPSLAHDRRGRQPRRASQAEPLGQRSAREVRSQRPAVH
jgi:hypothetical protein